MSLLPGTTIGRYEIRSLLGKGGMGEVYLVHDAQDGCLKALKMLSVEFAADAERLRRFEQEALATSALRHPNIIGFYELGQINKLPFLIMEFVAGRTLREQVRHARLSLKEALRVVAQVADALSAAHECGIVHRDIKPENVMLNGDGSVKVLDFGLAKLTETLLRRAATPDASTMANVNTDHGAAVGTTSYMSPEQLRGLPVDERADIWSLGVLLHEVLTLEQPFCGNTTGEVVVSILEREPTPLSQCWPEAPENLQQIVSKALRKNPEERYQTAAAFQADLKQFLQSTNTEPDLLIEVVPRPPDRNTAPATPPQGPQATHTMLPLATDPVAANISLKNETHTTDAGGGREKTGSRWSFKAAWPLLLTFTLALGIGFYGYERTRRARAPGTLQTMRVTRLNLPGDIVEAVVSPDGRFVATIVERDGIHSIAARELSTSRDSPIFNSAERTLKGLSFSPDSRYVYFLKSEDQTGTLWRASAQGGGDPSELLRNVNTSVTFSPDGRRIAFVRYDLQAQTSVLMTADPDGGDVRTVATRKPPNIFMLGSGGPAWSPDGENIACITLSMAPPVHMGVESVRVVDSSAIRLNEQAWGFIERVAWAPDGSGLVLNANEQNVSPAQIWFLPRNGAAVRRITNDPNSYQGLSLTATGDVIVTTRRGRFSDIWLSNGGGRAQARKVPASKYKGSNGIAWTPGGRLAYSSSKDEDEAEDLWTMGADGSNDTRLTYEPHNDVQPALSSDGRHMVFVSYRDGTPHVYIMNADSSNARQLTHGLYEDTPQLSPDGAWVAYHAIYPGKDSLWRVPTAGGEPMLLTSLPSLQPAVSPDGKLIACFAREDRQGAPWRIAVIPFEGGLPVKWFDPAGEIDPGAQPLRWTADGRALTYVGNALGVSNIWAQPLDGGAARQVTTFADAQIFSFAWSADGEWLACVRGVTVKDVMLIQNYR